jgi:hypothetical protein
MKRFGQLFLTLLLLAAVSTAAHAQTPPWTGIVASSRAMNWDNVGAAIPTNRTQCGSTIAAYGTSGSPASPATINNAIAACAANTYVLLAAGNFYLSSGVVEQSPANNVTLRGAGANQTFLIFYNQDACEGFYADVCFESGDLNYSGSPQNLTNWTAGYSQGATTITLTTVTNLAVGNFIILDQLDTGTSLSNDTLFICSTSTLGNITPNCALQGQAGAARNGRAQAQFVFVTQCDGNSTTGHVCSSGTNMTISPGLYMANWASGNTPQAWWSSSPMRGAALEDVTVDNSNSSGTGSTNVMLQNCQNCWIKGVTSTVAGYAHFEVNLGEADTIENSYMFRNNTSGSSSYGAVNYGGGDVLIQNNISQGVPLPYNVTGASQGTVVGYNFNILNFYGTAGGAPAYLLGSFWDHTDGTELVLWEGNHGPSSEFDLVHGTHNLNTLFRNYFPGQGTCITGPTSGGNLTINGTWGTSTVGTCLYALSPVSMDAYGGRIFNFVGNVLGQTGVQVSYTNSVNVPAASPPVYGVGGGNNASGITVNNDFSIIPLLMRWGNCDAINGFSAANCQFNSAEIPSSLSGDQAPYQNSVPASHTLPASFYLSGTPPWWPSGKPFPPIGPDVTGGNESGTGGLAYSIPAEDCYFSLGGQTNGYNTTVLPFNESTCYGSATAVQPPAAPTNLTATVN